MNSFAERIMQQKYSHTNKNGDLETWNNIAYRVTKHVMKSVGENKSTIAEIEKAIREMKFMPAGRYLYSAGLPYHQTQNCLALRAEDSREGWADLLHKASMALMTGAGIGVNYSDIRGEGKKIRRTGGTSTGPIALMQMVNDVGKGIIQGGSRRSAILATLNWDHADIIKFLGCKNNSEDYLKGTNISVSLDDLFFKAYNNEKHPQHNLACQIYWAVIESMCKNGEPGFLINIGENSKEILTNACSEFKTEDDSDICNLGSINLANVKDATEFAELLELATRFLLAGTVYSDVPYAQVDKVRSKNRTIGIGLMGVHEFLLKQGAQYGNIKALEPFLALYKETGKLGVTIANEYEINKPRKTRAIAPTGTIGIIAETSTGIEPLFCVAYKRRFMKGDSTYYQYVIDPTAKRLIDEGMSPDMIEDAYTLSHDLERRIAFQADMQEYVDMGISSTLNLPAWGSESNNEKTLRPFGNMLMKYLPRLRGITAYPDGGRSGQPLTPVAYSTACRHIDQLFVEGADICDITKKGSCNS